MCPSGAMTYASPRVCRARRAAEAAARGVSPAPAARTRRSCSTTRPTGRELVRARCARRGKRGLPARVIPLEVFHVASVGIDTMLGALAYGASQVLVLSGDADADEYGAAVEREMGYAQAILSRSRLPGTHLQLVRATETGRARARGLGSRAGRDGPGRGDVQPLQREARHARLRRRPSRPAGAGTPGRGPARRRGAVRAGRGQQGDLYALHGLRRRVPRVGAARRPRRRRCSSSSSGTACSAGCASKPVPKMPSPWCPGCC